MRQLQRDLWKQQLADRAVELLKKLGPDQPGNAWQRDFVSRLIVGEFGRIPIRVGRDRVSRLMYDIPTSQGRGRVFLLAATQFPDEPHFLAQYGRFLYDEDTRFNEARTYLQKARDLATEDSRICHMLGMSYRRELHEILIHSRPTDRTPEQELHIEDLLEQATKYFEESRRLEHEDEHGYVTNIECLIELIKDGFKRFPKGTSNQKMLRARSDLRKWLDEAFEVLDEAEVYLRHREDTHMWMLRTKLEELHGDLSKVIEAYNNLLDAFRSDRSRLIDPRTLKRQLARCLYKRGCQRRTSKSNKVRSKANKDFQRAVELMAELIHDEPGNPRHLGLWFQCARMHSRFNKVLLTERLENYYAITESLDGAFYLMCLYFIRGLEERNPEAFRQYERYQVICENLSSDLSHRHYKREWLGHGYAFIPNHLVYNSAIDDYETERLMRIEGIIKKVFSPTQGKLSIPPYGQTIYFSPHRRDQRFYRSDIDKPVSFFVAFSYDEPIAFNVQPA